MDGRTSAATSQPQQTSVEFLLKRVYVAHRTAIKELRGQLSKETKNSTSTCSQCKQLKTSLAQLREQHDRQLELNTENTKLIEELRSQLRKAIKRDDKDELQLESEYKSQKRKRGILSWSSKITDSKESTPLQLSSSSQSNSQLDNVLVDETLPNTSFNNDFNEQLVVPETVPVDVECFVEDEDVNKSMNASLNDTNVGSNSAAAKTKKKPRNQFCFNITPRIYRKSKYKQTTLTQNMFASGVSKHEVDSNKAILESLKSTNNVEVQDITVLNSPLDETFISPKYLKRTVAPKLNRPLIDSRSGDASLMPDSLFGNDILAGNSDNDSTCSEDLLLQLQVGSTSPVNKTALKHETLDIEDDFDVVPSKKSPTYKYKRETVRRQEDRQKLDGHECRDCEAYFALMDLTEEEKQVRLKQCSRHRDKHVAAATPDHFWSIRFPTTQECRERGVLDSTQNKPLQSRRRRQLNLN